MRLNLSVHPSHLPDDWKFIPGIRWFHCNEVISSMKTTYLAIIAIVSASVLLAGCLTAVGQSTLIIAVKDAPKTTDIGTITSLNVTIREVSVHRANASEPINEADEEMTATETEDTSASG